MENPLVKSLQFGGIRKDSPQIPKGLLRISYRIIVQSGQWIENPRSEGRKLTLQWSNCSGEGKGVIGGAYLDSDASTVARVVDDAQ